MQRARKDVCIHKSKKKKNRKNRKKSHLQANALVHPHTLSAGAAESMQLSSGIFLCVHSNAGSHCGPAPQALFAVSAAAAAADVQSNYV